MITLPEEKLLYSEIQKKLFYIIPEKWESIFLYASVIDVPKQKPIGEMYFYYLPKGIIKKKYVNGYEIPNLFNIDEEQYSKLITDVYNLIKRLRERFVQTNKKVWSSVSISIVNFKFKVEYDYEDLRDSVFDSYQRHVIWRYNYLKESAEILSRKDRKIVEEYKKYISNFPLQKKDMYEEGMYKKPVNNIIDFEKTLSVEEAIAQSKEDNISEEKKKILFKKNKRPDDIIEETEIKYNNQILNSKK